MAQRRPKRTADSDTTDDPAWSWLYRRTDGGARSATGAGGNRVHRAGNGGGRPKERPTPPDKSLDPAGFNRWAEAQLTVILNRLTEDGPYPVGRAIQEIAWTLNVSTETAKRYVLKWTAPSAPFGLVDGAIVRR